MDDFRELRRRERAQDALRRIYVESGQLWTGTGEPTKRTRTSRQTDSSSSCDAHGTSDPTALSSLGTGKEPSHGRTAQ